MHVLAMEEDIITLAIFMTVKIATFIRSYFHQLLCVIHDRLDIV